MDSLGDLEAEGWRVVWVPDLDGDVLVLDEVGIILADLELDRDEVARAAECP